MTAWLVGLENGRDDEIGKYFLLTHEMECIGQGAIERLMLMREYDGIPSWRGADVLCGACLNEECKD